jgi:hypothetical protein
MNTKKIVTGALALGVSVAAPSALADISNPTKAVLEQTDDMVTVKGNVTRSSTDLEKISDTDIKAAIENIIAKIEDLDTDSEITEVVEYIQQAYKEAGISLEKATKINFSFRDLLDEIEDTEIKNEANFLIQQARVAISKKIADGELTKDVFIDGEKVEQQTTEEVFPQDSMKVDLNQFQYPEGAKFFLKEETTEDSETLPSLDDFSAKFLTNVQKVEKIDWSEIRGNKQKMLKNTLLPAIAKASLVEILDKQNISVDEVNKYLKAQNFIGEDGEWDTNFFNLVMNLPYKPD